MRATQVPPSTGHFFRLGDDLPPNVLRCVASFLLPNEEAVCVRVCRFWFDGLDQDPRWQRLFETLFWAGKQVISMNLRFCSNLSCSYVSYLFNLVDLFIFFS